MPDLHHGYFSARENVPEGERKIGSIVITADKGLAGAYNHNIVKLEEEILARPGIHKLFIVGELGRHYFAKRDVQIDTNFQYTVQKSDDAQGEGYCQRFCSTSSGRGNWTRSILFIRGWKILFRQKQK